VLFLGIVVATSSMLYLVGVGVLSLSTAGIGTAIKEMFFCVGLLLLIFGMNLSVLIVVALVSRSSVYVVKDFAIPLLFFSLLQAITFHSWRRDSNRP
jgi:hypothetical protein